MIRVLVVDDHRLVRAGLITLLAAAGDFDVVGESADGAEGVAVAREVRPDVVLMDLSMPVLGGVAATRQLLSGGAATRVVALTSFSDRQRVADVIAAGAIGYLLKDCAPDELLAAVRAAAAGHSPLDPRVAGVLLPSRTASPADGLSPRELEVLRLAAKGWANKQIARKLGISESTVKVHLGSVFRQLGVGDRTSAARWARAPSRRAGLIWRYWSAGTMIGPPCPASTEGDPLAGMCSNCRTWSSLTPQPGVGHSTPRICGDFVYRCSGVGISSRMVIWLRHSGQPRVIREGVLRMGCASRRIALSAGREVSRDGGCNGAKWGFARRGSAPHLVTSILHIAGPGR